MNTRRPYTMRARAAGVEATRLRILEATLALSATRVVSEISLDDVAGAAGVSVQTVLRHFGSRTALIRAASAHGAQVVAQERRSATGDQAEALKLLVEHYERRGDTTVLLLAQEAADDVIGEVVERGREVHRDWVRETFRKRVELRSGQHRQDVLDLLSVVTDVYTWKLLRRDQGSSQPETLRKITYLVDAVLAAPRPEKS